MIHHDIYMDSTWRLLAFINEDLSENNHAPRFHIFCGYLSSWMKTLLNFMNEFFTIWCTIYNVFADLDRWIIPTSVVDHPNGTLSTFYGFYFLLLSACWIFCLFVCFFPVGGNLGIRKKILCINLLFAKLSVWCQIMNLKVRSPECCG